VSDVPVSIIQAAVAVCERHGIPRATLLGAPSVEEAALRHGRRVPWPAFCEFNDRVELAWKKRGGLAQFGRAYADNAPAELTSIARALIPPGRFLRLMFGLGTWAHPGVEIEVTDRGPDELELRIHLDPRLRDSPSFFRICGATMASATLLIGLPPTPYKVELQAHQARYVFSVPPSKTLFARAHAAVDQRTTAMLDRIEELQSEIRELLGTRPRNPSTAERRLTELRDDWGLTPRQCEVLRLISRGSSNREISSALGLAERTVEIHVTDLLRKSGLDGRARLIAAFWSGAPSSIPSER